MQIKLIGNKFSCGTKRRIFKFKMLAGIRDTLYISLQGDEVVKFIGRTTNLSLLAISSNH